MPLIFKVRVQAEKKSFVQEHQQCQSETDYTSLSQDLVQKVRSLMFTLTRWDVSCMGWCKSMLNSGINMSNGWSRENQSNKANLKKKQTKKRLN